MKVPDAIEPLAGFRVWAAGLGRLWSPSAVPKVSWPTDGELVARCPRFDPSEPLTAVLPKRATHPAPDPRCRCGIYAVFEPWELGRIHVAPPFQMVVGRVMGWGRTVVGGRGWRAARARPLELWSLSWWSEPTRSHLAQIAASYSVPLLEWPLAPQPGREVAGGATRKGCATGEKQKGNIHDNEAGS